jgi:hypothetical protein
VAIKRLTADAHPWTVLENGWSLLQLLQLLQMNGPAGDWNGNAAIAAVAAGDTLKNRCASEVNRGRATLPA